MKTISVKDAAAMIPDGATVMIGGFMGVGTPERLVDELVRQGRRNLTVISNDNAIPGVGIGKLVSAGAVKKAIASHIGLNPETQKKMLAGEIEVDLGNADRAHPRRRLRLGWRAHAHRCRHGRRERQAAHRGRGQAVPARDRAARRLLAVLRNRTAQRCAE